MTDTKDTVAVPVALLRTILTDYGPENYVWQQVTPLLPKLKPRLVAITYEGLLSSFNMLEGGFTDQLEKYLDQPDLLTLLDEALTDGHADDSMIRVDVAKAAIRTALGVSE